LFERPRRNAPILLEVSRDDPLIGHFELVHGA
jgi:hypothetical protein